MSDMIKSLLRRDARYGIHSDAQLQVSLETCDGTSQRLDAVLLDISARGAKFKVKQAFGIEEAVSVKIEIDEPQQTIATSAKVRWVAPVSGEDWWLGCAFDEPIKSEILSGLAISGVLERRQNLRQRISVETTAKWELNRETIPVRILDYSPGGGFCMLSSTPGKTGDRTLVRFQMDDGEEFEVCGIARWQVETEEGFAIGCELQQSRNSPNLGQLVDPEARKKGLASRIKRRLRANKSDRLIGTRTACILALMFMATWFADDLIEGARREKGIVLKTVSVEPPSEEIASDESQARRDPAATSRMVLSFDQSLGSSLYVAPRPESSHESDLPLLDESILNTQQTSGSETNDEKSWK